ncbi:MAG: hypothetical protein K9M45_07990 [Kiritimatiellales bacterium]|nr:hypothetical protein [Kiritimatiellales bacterium]
MMTKRAMLVLAVLGICAGTSANCGTCAPMFTTYDDAIKAGDKLFAENKSEEAMAAYKQALPLQKNADQIARVDLKLGRCLAKLKKCDEALVLFDKVLATQGLKDISYASALIGKGDTYMKLKNKPEAMKCFQQVVSHPGSNDVMKKRAQELIDKK